MIKRELSSGGTNVVHWLLLADYHCEYPFADGQQNNNFASAQVIFDWIEMEDLFGEAECQRLMTLLPDFSVFAEGTFNVWRLAGNTAQLQNTFREYVNRIFSEPPSGDDDVFDYWPSAVKNAYQLALDLDDLMHSEAVHLNYLKEGFENFDWEMKDEFEPPW